MKRALACMILLFASAATAQTTSTSSGQVFPTKPVRLVATSTPGSPVDIYARAIAEPLAKGLGQPVVVENRAGAGGTLAAGYVLGTEGDGHVTLVNTSAQIIAPFVYGGLAFDMLRDF